MKNLLTRLKTAFSKPAPEPARPQEHQQHQRQQQEPQADAAKDEVLINAYCTVWDLPAIDFPHTLAGRRDLSDPELAPHLSGFVGYVLGRGDGQMTHNRYHAMRHIQRVQQHLSLGVAPEQLDAFAGWAQCANAIAFLADGSIRDPQGRILLAANGAEPDEQAALPYPQQAWQRVRIASKKPDVLGRLKALAAWREIEAQDKNLPRGRIVKDETLADIASHPPRNQEELGKVRGLSATWRTNDIGARLMNALAKHQPLGRDEMPDREPRRPGLGKDGALVADLLKLLLKIRAREIDVAARLLTRAEEMEALAAGVRDLPVLKGWRFEVFGKDALDLVEGKLAFAVERGKLKMTHIDDVPAPAPEPDSGADAMAAE
mgnify:CR=1 FL=1